MKRPFVGIVALVVALPFALTACSSDEPDSASGSDRLVVYTARSEALNNAVIPAFEEATGVKIDVVTAGTGELVQRVASEGSNPLGDVLWAADETMLSGSTELFEKYVSSEDANMQESFRNTSGYFTPAFADPTVMIVNTNLQGDIEINGFEDLLNPELKGKIAFGDPVNSSSAFQFLMAMLHGMGTDEDPMSDEAWDYVDQFLTNLDGKIVNSSSQVYTGVASGEYIVGLTWEDPAANLQKEGAPVEVVFPEEGAVFPGESVQIIKGAKNLDNAQKFVDFMLSQEVQETVGQTTTIRPLRDGITLADYMTAADDIVLFAEYDEAWVSENKDVITKKYQELRTS